MAAWVLCTVSIAEAVQIDKPTDGECAVHQNAPEGAVVTNSGHYAYASGTMYPFN
jgi:hypothetical protein